jgi:hypothetical protein
VAYPPSVAHEFTVSSLDKELIEKLDADQTADATGTFSVGRREDEETYDI